ncbi:hypothetical protein FRC03_010795 [Tulasnella sp. 419]|nr:hypothetical protein FRC03_010795 [Tulasnella sp. 419]
MAGNKRAKLKKSAAGIVQSLSPSPPVPEPEDDGLIDDLLAQIDQNNGSSSEAAAVMNSIELRHAQEIADTGVKKKDPRSRHRERQAKKASALAASYEPNDQEADARFEREKAEEAAAIKTACEDLGLEMWEVQPDGHCLYAAIADQLACLSLIPPSKANYQTTRETAADYLSRHQDDFLPFIPSVNGEDGQGATDSTGLMTPDQYKTYCSIVRNTGAWGGEPEIMALSKAYNVPIHVVQWGSPSIVCHSPAGDYVDPKLPSVKISYHRRMYGLGEHYNSLRPKLIE